MNSLLPPNATPQERALEVSTSRVGGSYSEHPIVTVDPIQISGTGYPDVDVEVVYAGMHNGARSWTSTGRPVADNIAGDTFTGVYLESGFWKVVRWVKDFPPPYIASASGGDHPVGLTYSPLDIYDDPPTLTGGTVNDHPQQVFDVPIRDLWNADTCPADLLPWLAWTLNVDIWNPDWTETIKRAVVKNAVNRAREKGTVAAVKGILSDLGAGSVIVEWWQKDPVGTPHTFTVNIVSNDTSVEMQQAMAWAIDLKKPLRSHYDIVFGIASEASINIVGVLRAAVFARLDGGATY